MARQRPSHGKSFVTRRSPLSFTLTVTLCIGLFAIATLPGCGGCRKTDDPTAKKKKEDEEKKKKDKEKPKKDFEFGRLMVQPSDDVLITRNLAKPGHWLTGTQLMRANNYEFNAEILSQSVDKNMRPIDVEHTNYQMQMWRPASLPKGQIKDFEMLYFIPRRPGREKTSVWIQSRLRARRGGREVPGSIAPEKLIHMPAYQYLFVVLSSDPDRYSFLKRMASIAPPSGTFDADNIVHYRVILPKIKQRVPLPTHSLTWTTIAVLLWDNLNPNDLSPDQQQAMLDWLHWGGQLIVSGPNSLDSLRGSFLDEYLPAQKMKSTELGPSEFDKMNVYWSIPEEKRKGDRQSISVHQSKPLVGVKLKKHAQAEYLPNTGELVAERQIGRGRIVVTAFNLPDRPIVNWGSFGGNFDSFFNACLLRRPRREFSETSDFLGPKVDWVNFKGRLKDARLVSTLRYFGRDMQHAVFKRPDKPQNTPRLPGETTATKSIAEVEPNDEETADGAPAPLATDSDRVANRDRWHFGGYQTEALSGVAGWNDTGGTARAARLSLQEAAGISVPKSSFVLKVLMMYLVVLVPVNWGLFRLIGRVEWAWIAAPVIAILGAVAVVRLAQLDIGFARSRTEIAVLETYGDYDRGHLSRYTALYTSLSSTYRFSFEDSSALAQPFAVDTGYDRDSLRVPAITASFRREDGAQLDGVKVKSNSTGIVHCEQMCDLGGSLKLAGDPDKGFQIDNQSSFTLRDVGVIYRPAQDKVQVAWVGTLASKTAAPLRFQEAENNALHLRQWDESATMTISGNTPDGEVNLSRMVELATDKLSIGDGEVRLIGWTEDPLPGLTIEPRASQTTLRTFVLAHLRPGALPNIRRDANCLGDVKAVANVTTDDPNYSPLKGLED